MRRPIRKKKLLALVQQFEAITAVGASAMRGQPKKTAEAFQGYLGRMDLGRLRGSNRPKLLRQLDLHTQRIQRSRKGARPSWGVARKALNLFLRACFYNRCLYRAYGLATVGRWLEVPLDKYVVRGLSKDAGAGALPKWNGLKRLRPEESEQYQNHARRYAAACKLPATVFLDNYLWLLGRARQAARRPRR